MKNDKKDNTFKEGLKGFRHRVNYKINESATYNRLIGANDQFDEIPSITNEAGEEAPQKPGAETPPMGMGEPPAGDAGAPGALPEPTPGDAVAGAPAPDPALDGPPDGGGSMPEPPMVGGPQAAELPGMGVPPQQQVDDIQNDIIKHNTAAMQSINDQLKSLNATVDGLNSQLDALSSDVEEVREPTNTEKLMSKKNVSYPYYFNLNDFWNGNWFNEKRNAEQEKGVRELPDGTFIADFDDLPQQSKTDVQNSFNDYN